jgi:hypothetical protein
MNRIMAIINKNSILISLPQDASTDLVYGLNNGQDADDDEVNTYQIVKYLGENHDNDAENQSDDSHD